MDTRGQSPDSEPKIRRDWSYWLGLLVIFLMVCTVLFCATLFWVTVWRRHPHM